MTLFGFGHAPLLWCYLTLKRYFVLKSRKRASTKNMDEAIVLTVKSLFNETTIT